MIVLKSLTGRVFRLTSNKTLRHYTIKTESAKFRTYKLTREEFNNMDYFTGNDWQNFLKTDDYYKV